MIDTPSIFCCKSCYEYYTAHWKRFVKCPNCNKIQYAIDIEKHPSGNIEFPYARETDDEAALMVFREDNLIPSINVLIDTHIEKIQLRRKSKADKIAFDKLPLEDKLTILEKQKEERNRQLQLQLEQLRTENSKDFTKTKPRTITSHGKSYSIKEAIHSVINKCACYTLQSLRRTSALSVQLLNKSSTVAMTLPSSGK